MKVVQRELTNIPIAIHPPALSISLLATLNKEPLVWVTTLPILPSKSMLFVMLPKPLVFRTFIIFFIYTKSNSFVIRKIPYIQVTIRVLNQSEAILFITIPKSMVNTPVSLLKDSKSLSLLNIIFIDNDLTRIHSSLFLIDVTYFHLINIL